MRRAQYITSNRGIAPSPTNPPKASLQGARTFRNPGPARSQSGRRRAVACFRHGGRFKRGSQCPLRTHARLNRCHRKNKVSKISQEPPSVPLTRKSSG